MSFNDLIGGVLSIIVILIINFFVDKKIKAGRKRVNNMMHDGIDINVTILSMKQTGLFTNHNPVVEIKLKAENNDNNETWLIEKHNETIFLIALNDYQVGNTYKAKLNKNNNDILFVRDKNQRPVSAQP